VNDGDFFAVASRQRAHRDYADTPVSDQALEHMLEAATYAPSAENRQPWEFVVVRDGERRAAIGMLLQRAWESVGRRFSEGRLPSKLLADVERGATGGLAAAPVAIVVCADVARGLEQTAPSSIFPAVQNLLLAATALGLGSALTTIGVGYRSELRNLLRLPEHVVPMAIVPVGHPARPLGPPRREPFSAHTHRERYGSPWR
jgi:nitroreductase